MSNRRVHVIRRAEQVEVLTSPLRHQIVATMELLGPVPVRVLAEHLGREPEALYYHIRKLVAAGLVYEAGRRSVGQRSEAVFSLIARDIRVDTESRAPKFLEMVARSASALLRLTERAYLAAVRDPIAVRGGKRRNLAIRRYHVRLTDKSLAELNRRLDELGAFLVEHDDPEADRAYAVTLAQSPDVDQTD